MKTVELRDFLRYEFLSALEIAPGGRRAAFVKSHCDEEKNGYDCRIHLLDLETMETKPLTSGGVERSFFWTGPDRLLFPAQRDAALQKRVEAGEDWTCYYQLDLSGGEAREYMRVPKKVLHAVPISDDLFALTCVWRNDVPDPHEAPEAEREAMLRRNLEAKDYLIADEIPFRHNGSGFHNGSRSRLYLYDRREGTFRALTDEWQNVEYVSVRGDEVLFTAMHFHKEKRMGLTTGVYLHDLKTGGTKTLVAEDAYRIRSCDFWDGDIAFAGSDLQTWGPNENPHFYRVTREGKLSLIAENQESACNSVGSDCRYGGGEDFRYRDSGIYFLSTQGGHALVKRVKADGTIEVLTPENGVVDCLDVAGDRLLYVGLKENRLQELYAFENGQEKRLTDFNEWVQRERTLSTPERFTFEGKGGTIEGYVMKPVGFDPGKRYPAILDIHGGHKCAYGPVFYHEMQLWANAGYFVFFCNPRGSDGGGNVFAEIIDAYGEIDYVDIMDFTDQVLARHPQIDPQRLGVTGGSYGGYMTNWIIGHTDRFRCACSQRSISNFFSEFGTADTGYYFPLKQFFGSNPWEHTERYWFHSPLRYADQCKTPTLFIHSEEDYRCPLQEGIQMFTALKFHGVEARLCMFKGENHELSRSGKPSHRQKRLEEITDWFERYLK